jgi:transporter family protein
MIKEWAVYSLMALVVWGFWGFLPKVAVNSLDPKTAFIYEVMGGVATGVIVFFIFKPELGGVALAGVIPSVLTGVAGYIGLLCFLYALRGGKVSVIAPLTALYPVVSLALAIIFLKEKVSPVQITGIILAVVSVFLISYE